MPLSLYLKALHVIFIVTWFSGLFFMGRLFIYHREAMDKPENEKSVLVPVFKSAEKRVWLIIVVPSMIITILIGGMLMMETGAYREGWFHLKLLMVLFFIGYNFHCNKIRKRLRDGTLTLSSFKLRLINEIPVVFLVAIVFTVFLKSFFSGLWAGAVLTAIVTLSGLGYSFLRKKNKMT